ncbi:SAM domain-containing protein [Mesorhizobium sp. M0244]|uniref:SAM domain-containing protein n=1 Tax=Mesorhizobium sp. M0244 TaxID=2956926 RepID=UPI003338216D
MDVGSWLRSLGLGQYAAAFEDNAVDAETLRELTAEDLKELGVSLVGPRGPPLAGRAPPRATTVGSRHTTPDETTPPGVGPPGAGAGDGVGGVRPRSRTDLSRAATTPSRRIPTGVRAPMATWLSVAN